MVSTNALPNMGGVETHINEVANRLSSAGTEVTVLTTDRSGDLAREEALGNYRVKRWPAYPRSRDYYFSPGLVRNLRPREYDIVHVQGIHALVPPMALAIAQSAGVPTVLTFHTGGHSSVGRGFIRPLHWRLLAPLLRSTTELIAVSEHERQLFAKVLKVPSNEIHLMRNGSDPLPIDDLWAPPDGTPLLVSVGRLERYKGHHRILEAMPAILARRPKAHLVIAGSGPYEGSLRTLADELGVRDHVMIEGFGPDRRSQMGKLIADADVMCLLSEYEAHPVAVMEAVGAGTNALVADTSGLSELGREGIAVAIPLGASPKQIASAVIDLASMPSPSGVAITSWDECALRLSNLYAGILNNSRT